MFVPIITVIATLLLSAEADEDAACSQCMHVSYELKNVPAIIATPLESIFSRVNNPACESNTVQPQTCKALQYPAWMEHKCIDTQLTLTASNLLGVLPSTEMTVTLTTRGCQVQWQEDDGEEGCISLSEVDADERAKIISQLASLSTQWESVSYSGEVCTETP